MGLKISLANIISNVYNVFDQWDSNTATPLKEVCGTARRAILKNKPYLFTFPQEYLGQPMIFLVDSCNFAYPKNNLVVRGLNALGKKKDIFWEVGGQENLPVILLHINTYLSCYKQLWIWDWKLFSHGKYSQGSCFVQCKSPLSGQ